MSTSPARLLRQFRRRPLAACVIALFALAAPEVGSCVAVTNCNDVGPNSLRAAITNTPSGGTVDMTGLTMCSTITLEDFQIVIPQQDLTILGPPGGVTIAHDGSYGRVLNHQGSGLLRLGNLTITGGNPYNSYQTVAGGCIYSKGSVYLKNSSVTSCFADADANHRAEGGGIFTVGMLTLVHSTLSGNVAGHLAGLPTYGAYGGGAYVGGFFTAEYSSIRGNSANGHRSATGGVHVRSGVLISSSTISGNSAEYFAGLCACGINSGAATIESSTISDNHATNITGGVYSNIPMTVRNSTIAFNTAASGKADGYYIAPGLATHGPGSTIGVVLESSILSNNTYTSNASVIENDFSAFPGTVTLTGNHNLIPASFESFAPGVVTVTACPLLGPLRDNGGPTQTHALLSHSPAIDQGTNSQHLMYDQRGSPYKRADGVSINFADIGAYEVQPEDIVFNTSFEGCP